MSRENSGFSLKGIVTENSTAFPVYCLWNCGPGTSSWKKCVLFQLSVQLWVRNHQMKMCALFQLSVQLGAWQQCVVSCVLSPAFCINVDLEPLDEELCTVGLATQPMEKAVLFWLSVQYICGLAILNVPLGIPPAITDLFLGCERPTLLLSRCQVLYELYYI